ncbi:uncharacterized protein [Dysidea avara]|uniref:uncharacterized protein n=1 Tax=Dysidea avara TaxID=196820 RepID=UPI003320EEB9
MDIVALPFCLDFRVRGYSEYYLLKHSTASCTYLNITYEEGQQIQPNCSTHCTCRNGEFECETVLCSIDGATCVASGGPHYQTFDLQFFDFQGNCEYILTTPCDSDEFIITVQNGAHNELVSCTDQVNITIANTEIILGRGDHVTVNGENRTQTNDGVINTTSEVQVLRVGGNTHVILLVQNIRIFWDGVYRVEVTVSTTWQNRLCGLCGNYNDDDTDDFMTPDTTLAANADEFGTSWITSNTSNCGLLAEIPRCQSSIRGIGIHICSALRGQSFSACHSTLDPQIFLVNCVFDYCNCNAEDREEYVCESLATYASACSANGIILPNWSDTYCRKLHSVLLCMYLKLFSLFLILYSPPIQCPAGMVYQQCGPICPQTCTSIIETCYGGCAEGCFCPDGQVIDEQGQCVDNSICSAGAVCRSENDTTWGIEWPTIPVGSVATEKCPGPTVSSGDDNGLASRTCLQDDQWDNNINVTQCNTVELLLLNDRANELEDLLRNSNNIVDPSVLSEVQAISEELAILTDTPDRPLVPNDLNTSNSVLNTLISILSLASRDLGNATIEDVDPIIQNVSSTVDNLLDDSNAVSYEMAGNMKLPVGEDLLQNIESLSAAVGDFLIAAVSVNITNQTNITIERDNIVLNARLPPVETELINDIVFPLASDTQVTIPSDAIIQQRSVEGDIEPVVSFVANNLQRYLVDESLSFSIAVHSPVFNVHFGITTFELSSPVTHMKDMGVHIRKIMRACDTTDMYHANYKPIAHDQQVKFDYGSAETNVVTTFINMNGGKTVGGWSTDGIIQDSSPGLPVLCNTTHLTSFAVLVSSGGSEGSLSLRIVSYIGCGISIVCLIVTIIIIIALRKRAFNGKQHLVHLNLSVALLLALITFVSGVETATNNRPGCIFITSLLQYLFLAVFSWSLCEGIMVFAMFVAPFYNGLFQKLLFYLIVGWGLPIPIVVISAGVSHNIYGLYDDDERWACWISDDDGAIWAFTAPMIAIIIVNYFFLAVSVYNIYKTRKYHQNLSINEKRKFDIARTVLISILALLPLLGGTWILGLLFLFDSDSEPLAWIFTILNSMQGVAIFYFRVVRNQEIATCYKKGWEQVTALTSSTVATPKDTVLDNKQALPSSTSPPSILQHEQDCQQLHRDLNSLGKWADEWKMVFNPQKLDGLPVHHSQHQLASAGQLKDQSLDSSKLLVLCEFRHLEFYFIVRQHLKKKTNEWWSTGTNAVVILGN